MTQEVRHGRSTWFNVLSVGDFGNARILHGTATGVDPEGLAGIMSFPVVWVYLGAKPDLRRAVHECGYFRPHEFALPPEVEDAISA